MKKLLLFLLVPLGPLFGISYLQENIANESLNIATMTSEPMSEFLKWYQEAKKTLGSLDASTMILGTATAQGHPSTRAMSIKSVDQDGVTFFGDARSQKFRELKDNPYASVTFYWPQLQRQVTLMGKAVQVDRKSAEKVFKERMKTSQAASVISKQGTLLQDRGQLLNQHQNILNDHKAKDIEMPAHWTGYKLIPQRVEFWQTGASILHSRVEYQKTYGTWKKQLLHP